MHLSHGNDPPRRHDSSLKWLCTRKRGREIRLSVVPNCVTAALLSRTDLSVAHVSSSVRRSCGTPSLIRHHNVRAWSGHVNRPASRLFQSSEQNKGKKVYPPVKIQSNADVMLDHLCEHSLFCRVQQHQWSLTSPGFRVTN